MESATVETQLESNGVRLAVKKIDPKFAQTPHPPHKAKTAVVQAVVLTTPGSHYRMDVAGCSCLIIWILGLNAGLYSLNLGTKKENISQKGWLNISANIVGI